VGISVDDKKQPDGTRKICVGRLALCFFWAKDSMTLSWVYYYDEQRHQATRRISVVRIHTITISRTRCRITTMVSRRRSPIQKNQITTFNMQPAFVCNPFS
jgi:hypothetical protein